MTQSQIIVGVFEKEAQAKAAIDALHDAGFANDQIGVAIREGGIVTPNLLNDLMDLGVPQNRAEFYDNEFRAGHTIVSVRADGRDAEVTNILRSNGAIDYDRSTVNADGTQVAAATNAQTDSTRTGNYAQDTTADARYANETDEQRIIRLREERLNVNKERVQAGEVELRKEVVTEQKTVNVPVTHEEVVIERRPVTGGQVDNAPIGRDEEIRVPVTEEEVQVTKTPVVTGEVAIGKREVQETQQVTDTVRREELQIENSGDARVVGDVNEPPNTSNRNPNTRP